MKILELHAVCVLAITIATTGAADHAKRAIQPCDCARVRRLLLDDSQRAPIQINPQGTRVAYLVKAPNLITNQNDIQIYVRPLPGSSLELMKPVLSSSEISSMQWLEDGRHLVFLGKKNNKVVVEQVDCETGKRDILAESTGDIVEYSIDSKADTLVFATAVTQRQVAMAPSREQIATGFRISFDGSTVTPFRYGKLFVVHKTATGWLPPKEVHIRSPFRQQGMSELRYYANLLLSLAPDGKHLLVSFTDSAVGLPEEWRESPFVKQLSVMGFPGITVTVLYDLEDHSESVPLKTPLPRSIPLWAEDSRSYMVAAQSPVGSSFERDDRLLGRAGNDQVHLFWVQAETGAVELVASHLLNMIEKPLLWQGNSLLVRTSGDTVSALSRQNGQWVEKSHIRIPISDFFRYASIASDGRYVVGDYENPTTPPELFLYRIGDDRVRIAVNLNPEFSNLTIAPVQEIRWEVTPGYEETGVLYLPPDYVEGKRYPLVIQTHENVPAFLCNMGEGTFPSYAPEPIANAGILYLIRTYPENFKLADEEAHYPSGFPGTQGYGGLQEAAFQVERWDAAVKTLDRRGLVDPRKVGIIGFSRKGWYTEFLLTHAATRFRAASATDNVQYSMGEYWLEHDLNRMDGTDAIFGGPPYGRSFENWRKYSVSFNLDKFHTPLLMEEMGNGFAYNETAPSLSLAKSYEIFLGLTRLNKPVELYYYPSEPHTIEHPQAMRANLQRNVDWFRFWLQAYERPNTEDREQYVRWRKLRLLQEEDEQKSDLSPPQASAPGMH